MRPQLVPAEAIARLNIKPPTRPGTRNEASDPLAGGFNSVLKRIRSARGHPLGETPRSQAARKPESAGDRLPDEKSQMQADNPAAAGAAVQSSGGSGSTSDQTNAELTTSPVELIQPVSAQQEGGEGDAPRVQPAFGSLPEGAEEQPQDVGRVPGPSKPPPVYVEGVEWNPRPTSSVPVPVEPVVVQAGANQQAGSQQPPGPPASVDPSDTDDGDSHNATTGRGRQSHLPRGEQASVVRLEERPDSGSKNAPDAGAQASGGGRRPHEFSGDLTRGPSIADRKIAIVESQSEVEIQRTDSATPNSGGGRHASGRLEVQGGLVEKGGQPALVAIGTAVGDNVAASVAKFMLSPASQDGGTALHAGVPSGVAVVQPGPSGDAVSSAGISSPVVEAVSSGGISSTFGVDDTADLSGVARVLSATSGAGRHQVTLRLEPPELGQLRLQIRMQHQAMTLQVNAESQAVARLIESRLSDLREALAAHGIRMGRADVVVRTPASAEASGQHQNSQQGGWAEHGRGMDEEHGGWAANDRWRADSEERQSSRQTAHDGEAEAEVNAGAVLAEEARAGVQQTPTTELSLDLIA